MNDAINLFAALGALLGAITAIITQLIPWLKNRDDMEQDRKKLELAKMEVEFITSWIKTANEFIGDINQNKKI